MGMTQAKSTQQIIGTMAGQRAIRFDFTMKNGERGCSVTFDFYRAGAQFDGATYARIEGAALRSMAAAGRLGNVETFTHTLIV